MILQTETSQSNKTSSLSEKSIAEITDKKTLKQETVSNLKEKTIDLFIKMSELDQLTPKPVRQIEQLRNQIIVSNKELVLHIVNKEYSKRVPQNVVPDLYQEGMLGMIKAISRFDVTRGVAFSTYAVIWIRQYVNTFLLTQTYSVRTPSNLVTLYGKIKRATEDLRVKFGREPEIKEIASFIDKPTRMVELAIYAVNTQSTSSLDEIHNQNQSGTNDSGVNLYNSLDADELEGVTAETTIDSENNYLLFKESFNTLSTREKLLIMIRYGVVSSTEEYFTIFGRDQ